MKIYRVMKATAELSFVDWKGRERAEKELNLGCTHEHDPDPELVAEFETLEAAREELEKYACTYCECQGYGHRKSYNVEEYYIEEVTRDIDGEEINWERWDYARDEISLKDYKVTCKAKFGNQDSNLLEWIDIALMDCIKARTEEDACNIAMEEIENTLDKTDDYNAEISSYHTDIQILNEDNELIEIYEKFTANLISN